jgi:hypothetical protein
MTTEEFKDKYYPEGCARWNFTEALSEFAKMKCEELLEIVVEKAELSLGISSCNYVVDEDSILNAVDLDEFIV